MAYSDIDQNTAAPFNMAISTLESIREILREIKQVGMFQTGESQKLKIELTKQLLLQSVPLLDPETVALIKEKVLSLKPIEADEVNKFTGRFIRRKIIFDWDMDRKLNDFSLEIQQKLQKKNYFMPPRKDLSKAVTDF